MTRPASASQFVLAVGCVYSTMKNNLEGATAVGTARCSVAAGVYLLGADIRVIG